MERAGITYKLPESRSWEVERTGITYKLPESRSWEVERAGITYKLPESRSWEGWQSGPHTQHRNLSCSVAPALLTFLFGVSVKVKAKFE